MRELKLAMHDIAMIPAAVAAGGACATGGILSWAAVAPSAQIFGKTVRYTGDADSMALTFDDGPNPAVTPQILDLLERHNVRGSFFLIGRHVRAFPALAREIVDRGHGVGNHTETHAPLAFLSPPRIEKELATCCDAIEEATRRKTRWVRPPFGFRGPQLARVLQRRGDERMVMWSAWARDWKSQPAELVIRRLHRAKRGDIVLLHDGDHRVLRGDRGHVVAALAYWLPRWKDAGIRFVTLDSLSAST
jgi:peptidoglycan/xylan/chitin deacetylase (PgdA/CDA1 family)